MHWDRQSFSFLLQIIRVTHRIVMESQKIQRNRGEAQQLSREVQGEEQFMNKLTINLIYKITLICKSYVKVTEQMFLRT